MLLLATVGDLDRVFLFDRVDREAGLVHWLLFDEGARAARTLESPITGYDRVIATAKPPRADELQIDRAWAVAAAQALIVAAN